MSAGVTSVESLATLLENAGKHCASSFSVSALLWLIAKALVLKPAEMVTVEEEVAEEGMQVGEATVGMTEEGEAVEADMMVAVIAMHQSKSLHTPTYTKSVMAVLLWGLA